MNKINKFRVWREDIHRFLNYDELYKSKINPLFSLVYSNNTGIGANICPEKFNQFIGKKDKNNKDIYEGDIVKYIEGVELGDKQNYVGVVKYDESAAAYGIAPAPNKDCFNYFYEWMISNIEIVGNIYENPQLDLFI